MGIFIEVRAHKQMFPPTILSPVRSFSRPCLKKQSKIETDKLLNGSQCHSTASK